MPPPVRLKAPVPALLVKVPVRACRSMARPVPDAVRTVPGFRTMLLPVVVPALETAIVWAVMVFNVTEPLVAVVRPVPAVRAILTAPVPALMVAPGPMVMTAAPDWRLALTVVRSDPPELAVRFRPPLAVVIEASNRIDRPAVRASVPPVLPPTVRALARVMSLEASSAILVPLARAAARPATETLLVPVGLVAKARLPTGTRLFVNRWTAPVLPPKADDPSASRSPAASTATPVPNPPVSPSPRRSRSAVPT